MSFCRYRPKDDHKESSVFFWDNAFFYSCFHIDRSDFILFDSLIPSVLGTLVWGAKGRRIHDSFHTILDRPLNDCLSSRASRDQLNHAWKMNKGV
jgi:hypothetical protein